MEEEEGLMLVCLYFCVCVEVRDESEQGKAMF